MNAASDLIAQLGWWGVFGFVVLATYFWRGLGVILAGQVTQESEVFKWLSCVTYALVGALTIKLILYPTSILKDVPVSFRLLVCGICIIHRIYFNGNLTKDLILGSGLMAAFGIYFQYFQ
jgi:branched-subunit amino acid transport protein